MRSRKSRSVSTSARPRSPAPSAQFVIEIVRLTLFTAAPLGSRSVIVTVPVPARSARNCHDRLLVVPAAIAGADCVADCGLCNRNALDGLIETATEYPVAVDPPELVTAAVAVSV